MSATAAERRQVVRAGADAVDRLARRLRPGVVARRHQDGRDLRGRARGLAGVARPASRSVRRGAITTESAHAPSWAGDSRHILYQSMDKLRIVDVETGETRTVPLDLKYTPAIPTDAAARARRHARRHEERRRRAPTSTSSSTATRSPASCRTPRRTTPAAGRRRVEPDGDAGADRVPLAPAAGLRRIGGPRVAGVRHHDGAQPGQHAVRSRSRSARPARPASGSARASTAPAT